MIHARPLATASTLACLAAGAASAQDGPSALYEALRLDEVIEIMHEEGLAYGDELEADLFPGRGGALWAAEVAQIYDLDAMQAEVAERFDAALDGIETAPVTAYFTEPTGAEIVALELSARRALMDPEIEQAARVQAQALDGDRLDRLETFITVNDLVEQNVSGAMNANLAFYSGLSEGGALMEGWDEGDILGDVWSQAPAIRDDTERWLYAFLGLAYTPLEDADLDGYIAISDTEAGRALNTAIFASLDALYNDISHALGVAAAGYMQGEDI